MAVRLRVWTLADAPALAKLINNKKVQDNLRDPLLIIQLPAACWKRQAFSWRACFAVMR